MKKVLYVVAAGLALFGLIQLVPIGKTYTNPPVVSEPNWSSPEARQLAKQACFQCHSNETTWPWYSRIAPVSWLIAFDVQGARSKFNFSDWNNHPGELDEMIAAINEGEMPPIQFWLFHPEARMNEQQRQALIQALESSLGQ